MTTGVDLLKIFANRRLPQIDQTEAAECGLACLAMIAGYHGLELDMVSMRRNFSVSIRGMTVKGLVDIANDLHFNTRAVRLEPEEMSKLALPAILHWDTNHFVVLKEVSSRKVVIHDPSRGIRSVGFAEVNASFTGVALEVSPAIAFKPNRAVEKLELSQLWNRISGMGRAVAEAVILTAFLEAWSVASPFLLQVVIDDVLPRRDDALLVVLCLGFGIFALLNAVASGLRQMLFLSVGNLLSYQIASNVGRHLLKLPLAFFERRTAGDILSRFSGVQPIQSVLTSGVVGALVDGIMALVTLGLMVVYSPWLSLLAVGTVLSMALIRVAMYQALKTRNNSSIVAQARHDAYLIETFRGMPVLKLFVAESKRHAVWQNRLADIANAKLGYGRISNVSSALTEGFIALESVVAVYIGAQLALSGGFSIGMLYAYLSYKGQFLGKATSLIDSYTQYRMLNLYLMRLGDIALSAAETHSGSQPAAESPAQIRGDLELRSVSFQYSKQEAKILRAVNIQISAGEHVAIVGPSGCGKTTLLKIATSLLQPTEGGIFVDGLPLKSWGLSNYRKSIAAVFQEDSLFGGSIAENIALFDLNPDIEFIKECAEVAAIGADIAKMPMQFETLVGEMGVSLSGGQRQRIILARALYRRPRILFMDEGTAHLDPATEAKVSAAIRALNITRIVVAHRMETIRHADRIIVLDAGAVVADRKANREGGKE